MEANMAAGAVHETSATALPSSLASTLHTQVIRLQRFWNSHGNNLSPDVSSTTSRDLGLVLAMLARVNRMGQESDVKTSERLDQCFAEALRDVSGKLAQLEIVAQWLRVRATKARSVSPASSIGSSRRFSGPCASGTRERVWEFIRVLEEARATLLTALISSQEYVDIYAPPCKHQIANLSQSLPRTGFWGAGK
jgi:hypothetical protein